MEQNKERQKFEDGVIPIGKKPTEFYIVIVYKELCRRNELKLISRGDYGVMKVLSILTDLLSGKVVKLENNQVVIDFIETTNERGQSVMLPNIKVDIKRI